jgi:hypothetical protein
MRSNAAKSLDRLRQLSWQNKWMQFLVCPLVGITVLICSQSELVSVLTYTLLSVMWTTLVEYRLLRLTAQALEDC